MNRAARVELSLIGTYQRFLSPKLGVRCRHYPTCSDYTAQAVGSFGAIRGSYLGLRRLARCTPFGTSGTDVVPTQFSWRGK